MSKYHVELLKTCKINVEKTLDSLASATPSMASALKIGIEGVQYDAEGQLTLALERYTASLEIMIPLLRKELKGRRKYLLHQQVKFYLFNFFVRM